MRISGQRVKQLCREKRISVGALLKRAGVSRTAYYSLARRESVLPRSVRRIAETLGVSPSAFLEEEAQVRHIRLLQDRARAICRHGDGLDRDVVLRTMMELERRPVERLRRALSRVR